MANSSSGHTNSPPKYPRKVGDLSALKRRLWWGILHCTYVFEADGMTTEQRLRAAHALSQLAMTFVKVVELTDLEGRLEALENIVHRRNGHGRQPTP